MPRIIFDDGSEIDIGAEIAHLKSHLNQLKSHRFDGEAITTLDKIIRQEEDDIKIYEKVFHLLQSHETNIREKLKEFTHPRNVTMAETAQAFHYAFLRKNISGHMSNLWFNALKDYVNLGVDFHYADTNGYEYAYKFDFPDKSELILRYSLSKTWDGGYLMREGSECEVVKQLESRHD